MARRLGCFLLIASLLLAFGGPGLLAHQALAHDAGHAHAHPQETSQQTPATPEPGAPEDPDCSTCHLLLHVEATASTPLAVAPALAGAAIEPLAAPAAALLQPTRDRPPGRGPPLNA